MTAVADPPTAETDELPADWRDLVENAPCGYLTVALDGTILRANRTFLAWTGYASDELVGARRLADLLGLAGRLFLETRLEPMLRLQGEVRGVALEIACRGGARLPVMVNAVQVPGRDGAPDLRRFTLMDMTERQAYEEALRAARRQAETALREKGELLAMIGHDIHNGLNALGGYVQLMERGTLTGQQARYLGIMRQALDTLTALTGTVMAAAEAEAGAVVLEPRRFALRPWADAQLAALAPRAAEKGLALRLEIADTVPEEVEADPLRLGQIVANLLANAVKFTEAGEVVLSVAAERPSARRLRLDMAVRDTGIGIDPERLEGITGAFVQGGPDIRRRFGGSGMGLAIGCRLLELMDSRLEIESAPGRGSVFRFSLDLPAP
ncbi:MAG TPA: ATP-binding protein [Azospirillaceae bacterium]|nr:ATP-binding protein [Azospirillaceae bacterium]